MRSLYRRRLLVVLFAGGALMAVEFTAGLWANSLVLLADATHYLTDLFAVLLALAALSWATKPVTRGKTFGYHRAEVVAAFVQALALWALSAWLLWEAVARLREPGTVDGLVVMAVGGGTLVLNGALAWWLQRGTQENLNLRAAYLHLLSDVMGSAAALAAGVFIYVWQWHAADSVLTFVVVGLVARFAWRLTRQTLHILLEGTPKHVRIDEVERRIRAIRGIKDVHDLHVWTLTSGEDSLSAHVVLQQAPRDDSITHAVHDELERAFRIRHVTVQVESPECPCETLRHGWGLAHA